MTTTTTTTASDWAGRTVRRIRSAGGTTPGWLRMVSVLVVAAMVFFALVSAAGVSSRRASIDKTASRLEPLVVSSQDAHAALVQADAAAAAAFLSGGAEDTAQLATYNSALSNATRQLQRAAESGAGNAATQTAVRAAAKQVPVYAGLVERARANNRLGYPVGAAYLRVASDLMHNKIIPAVERLRTSGDSSLKDEYAKARAMNAVVGILLLGAAAAGLLLLVRLQRFLVARTRRRFNPALIAATAITAVAGLWFAAGIGGQVATLESARADSYDVISAASRARVTAFDARADENLALIARGNGARFNDEFAAGVTAMGDKQSAALGDLVKATSGFGERFDAEQAASAWAAYLDAHREVVALVADGNQLGAVAASLGKSQTAFAAFDKRISSMIRVNQSDFAHSIDAAATALAPLVAVALIAAVAVSLLTLAGVAPRIAEYR